MARARRSRPRSPSPRRARTYARRDETRVADETPSLGPVDEAQIQVIAFHARPRRDAHVAGVGGGVCQEGERRAVTLTFDIHDDRPRLPPDELLERRDPEGALPR